MTIPDPGVPSPSLSNATGEERTSEATKTNCCIVGGGPAGAMLSLLLARAGVPVTLLEAHKDHLHGLLLIGDAAHVMLPLGGVGINCAIADAVEAANVLSEPLRAGRVQDGHLAEVQRRRERLTRAIQLFQSVMQKRIVGQALESPKPFKPPLPLRVILRVPGLRNLPARLIAFGIRRVRLERSQEIRLG